MDQAPAQTEQAPAKEPEKKPPPHPVPAERSFRLNLSGQAQTALMQGKLMDDATRTKLKASAEAQAAREERKRAQEQKRLKIEASKRRAIESDKLLGDAIARLVESDATRASAHREGGRLIEQADRRVEESQRQLDAAQAALAKAHEAVAKAIFEHGKTISAAQEARTKWSPEHADVSYTEARVSAQAAIVENEQAWHDVAKKFRKEKRNRDVRRTARELGLLMDALDLDGHGRLSGPDDRPERAEESEISDDDQDEVEFSVEGTFALPGAVDALMDEKRAMEELAEFQKIPTKSDAPESDATS